MLLPYRGCEQTSIGGGLLFCLAAGYLSYVGSFTIQVHADASSPCCSAEYTAALPSLTD